MDERSWYLDQFSLLVPWEMYGEQLGEYKFLYWSGLKGLSIGFDESPGSFGPGARFSKLPITFRAR